MWENLAVDSPYIIGPPIARPDDFFGRDTELSTLVDRIRRGLSVAIIARQRMGSSSLLHRLAQPDMLARMSDGPVCVTLIDCADLIRQPLDFYRRLGRRVKARSPEAAIDLQLTDEALLAEQVADAMASADCRWVLLLDNFEALAHFPTHFFEHLRAAASRSTPALVLASRVPLKDLGLATSLHSSPFYNIVQPLMLGPWTRAEFEGFLRVTSQRSGVDLRPYRDTIIELAGYAPALVQQVAAHFFEAALAGPVDVAVVRARAFEAMRGMYETIWEDGGLSQPEREMLLALAYGRQANGKTNGSAALDSLRRSGFVDMEGRIAIQLFAEYLRRSTPRILIAQDGRQVMVEGEARTLPRRDYELLKFLYDHAGTVCTTEDILQHVWGYSLENKGLGDDTMVYQRIRALRLVIEENPRKPQHIQNVPGTGYKFVNYPRAD